MKIAHIENGVIVNMSVAPDGYALTGSQLDATHKPWSIGWVWSAPAGDYLPPACEEGVATVFSKLSIRRACRRLGCEPQLDSLLASSPQFASDWRDATTIDTSDPVLIAALASATLDIAAIRAEIARGGA